MIYLLAFLTGFLALGYEIALTKVLFVIFDQSLISVTIVLSIFLLGLAFGSLLFRAFAKRIKGENLFGISNAFIALYSLFILVEYRYLQHLYLDNDAGAVGQIITKALLTTAYILPLTVAIGVLLPYVMTSNINHLGQVKTKVSALYATDLIGSVLGIVVTGLILLPYLGVDKTIVLTAVFNIVIIFLSANWKNGLILKTLLCLLCVIKISFFFYPDKPFLSANNQFEVPEDFYSTLPKKMDVLHKEASPFGTIQVAEFFLNKDDIRAVVIESRVLCYETLEGSIPLSERFIAQQALRLVNSQNIRAANIGLGCGFTSDELLRDKRVKSLIQIEINPKMQNATTFFEKWNPGLFRDQRMKLQIDDGFNYMAKTKETFEVVTIDVENPLAIHSSSLYTVENFSNLKKRLSKEGVLALWAFDGTDKYLGILFHSLRVHFPYVYIKSMKSDKAKMFFASKMPIQTNLLDLTGSEMVLNAQVAQMTESPLNTIEHGALQRQYFLDHFGRKAGIRNKKS